MTSTNEQPQAAARIALNEKETAAALGVSLSWLQHDRCGKRLIPFYRVGGLVRYNAARVSEALATMEEGGAAATSSRSTKRRGGAAA
ncbi:MAG: hypothetical protein EOO27_46000 [Comamonadaceae bacterium]|nr:MAG: hypothetical protein EOO27_46000 [Comamonadaceae bacterium]